MFKEIRFIVSACFILLFSMVQISFGQVNGTSDGDKKDKALEAFNNENYSEAYTLFSSLISKHPKDGLYHYYCGLSLYFQNSELEKAVEYLEYASGRPSVPSDVFYYLGMANREIYNFTESKKAFNKYASVANRTEQKEYIPARESEMSANAVSMTLEYNPFEILATSLFSFSDSTLINHVRGKGGILNKKPPELYIRESEQEDMSSFVFLPKEIQKGDFVYFSSDGKSKKKGLDLYRIKKNGGKKWGEPELIESLSTEFDEIMPYFDPVSNDLYFASKGYNSMGGYDVFKSHYDTERDSWSDPVSLGFPVNSPKNEYLAMPGYDLGTILLITDRQGLDKSLTVYKLLLSEPKQSLASVSREELQRIGNLGGISSIPAIVDLEKEELIAETNERNNPGNSMDPASAPEPADPYSLNIQTALKYQHKADSLMKLAKGTRVRVKTYPDPDDRWAFQRQIIEWEKLASDYQKKADQTYAQLKEYESNESPDIPETIEKADEIQGITVYKYTDAVVDKELGKPDTPGPDEKTADKSFNTVDEPGEVIKQPAKAEQVIKRFVILDASPYNLNNPYPLDVSLPEGPFYRIQLGVFSQTVSYSNFGGVSPITAETVPGKGLTRYYAGKFSRYIDARDALEQVKQQGFRDAFIVGWYNGEKMAISRIQEFEARGSD